MPFYFAVTLFKYENGELAPSSPMPSVLQRLASVGENVHQYSHTSRHALLRHKWPPVLIVMGAVRHWSWQETLTAFQTRCWFNLFYTQTFSHTHCIYTQAHTCLRINTCLWTSGSTLMYKRSFFCRLEVICWIPVETKPNPHHRWDKPVLRAPRLVTWCQVGGSLCCLCIVHILSLVCAGRGYCWGIWVSQNLTTEPAPAGAQLRRTRLRRFIFLAALRKRFRQLMIVLNRLFNSYLTVLWLHLLLNWAYFVLLLVSVLCSPCLQAQFGSFDGLWCLTTRMWILSRSACACGWLMWKLIGEACGLKRTNNPSR